MRRIAIVLVGLAVLSSARTAPLSAKADDLRGTLGVEPQIEVGSLSLAVGERGDLALAVHNIPEPGLGAWTIDVAFDPVVTRVVDCSGYHGGICNRSLADDSVRATGGVAVGLVGNQELAEFTFRCLAAGNTSLVPNVELLLDANVGKSLPIEPVEVIAGTLECFVLAGGPGDVNCDNSVNSIDAVLVLQRYAYLDDSLLSCPQNGDVSGDGEIAPTDASLILQYDAGFLTHLPP